MATATPLTALHGDSWVSPRWAVTMNGAATDLSAWTIQAQARQSTEADTALITWTVAGGGIKLGTAQVRLSNGQTITTGTVQLVLAPADFVALPRRWSGVVDVELSSDGTAAPAERRTVVRARKFTITPDVAR